jgi:eukaryotic-like serine/threonine-protein kinase
MITAFGLVFELIRYILLGSCNFLICLGKLSASSAILLKYPLPERCQLIYLLRSTMRYRAFISYSHADDKWACWLLRRLEAYRVPSNLVGTPGRNGPIPARLGKVFLDRDELPSAGNLSSTLTTALNESEFLVVICSTSSAKSRWVNAEVNTFLADGRGDNILSLIIDGDPASREPGIVCFPPALIEPEIPGGPEREPLAADARKEGDGRERAFLKLAAGLLGVGYDALAQREAQQRHRRMAYITAASLSGMTLALGLTVTAYIARNDAVRRQARAEDILGFMLGDLRKKLTTVGRLDLMQVVDDKATRYFATLDPRDLTDRALEEQVRSLSGIGEVRVNEGKNAEAMVAFQEAHARSTALYQRAPEKGPRLFDLAQTEYWIGYVAWQQGRFDDAKTWLGKYQASGVKLAAMDRNNFSWQKEIAYGYQVLAVLDESLGHYAEAERAMLSQRTLYTGWLKAYPKDMALVFEAANIASWLGTLAINQGKLDVAEAFFAEQVTATGLLVEREPQNANWKDTRLEALLLLTDVQILRGRMTLAQESAKLALQIGEALHAQDPKNMEWLLSLGKCHLKAALLMGGNTEDHLAKAVSMLNRAQQSDPKNAKTTHHVVIARLFQGEQALARNNASQALAFVNEAKSILDPAWKTSPTEVFRLDKARILILEGETFLSQGKRGEADQSFNQAMQLLREHTGAELPFRRLNDLVRVMHFLAQKEQAEVHRNRLAQSGFVTTKPYP